MTYQWQIFLASLDVALCYQIRTIDKQRLEQKLGELTHVDLQEKILAALRFQLDMA